MAIPEEEHQRQIDEQTAAYGKGDRKGRLAHIKKFGEQEEERLKIIRSRQGMSDPDIESEAKSDSKTKPKKIFPLFSKWRSRKK